MLDVGCPEEFAKSLARNGEGSGEGCVGQARGARYHAQSTNPRGLRHPSGEASPASAFLLQNTRIAGCGRQSPPGFRRPSPGFRPVPRQNSRITGDHHCPPVYPTVCSSNCPLPAFLCPLLTRCVRLVYRSNPGSNRSRRPCCVAIPHGFRRKIMSLYLYMSAQHRNVTLFRK